MPSSPVHWQWKSVGDYKRQTAGKFQTFTQTPKVVNLIAHLLVWTCTVSVRWTGPTCSQVHVEWNRPRHQSSLFSSTSNQARNCYETVLSCGLLVIIWDSAWVHNQNSLHYPLHSVLWYTSVVHSTPYRIFHTASAIRLYDELPDCVYFHSKDYLKQLTTWGIMFRVVCQLCLLSICYANYAVTAP